MIKKLFSGRGGQVKACEPNKVVIIGTGAVGTSAAYAMMIEGVASEIVLIDVNEDKCLGEASDLEHGLSFIPEVKISAGKYEDCRDARVIMISAGLAQKPGQTRLDLAKTNAKIVGEIVSNIKKYTREAVIMMVTNPLDVLTYVALKRSGFPPNRVFGTGTTLDSSRFRYFLAEEFGVATESMGAYLIGEHGDSSVPVYSHCNVMGEPITNLPQYRKDKVESAYVKARDAAAFLIGKKGFTCYGIGLAAARLVRAILYDEKHVFPVSVYLTGQHSIKDICLSLPAVIGRNGAERILDINLSSTEKDGLLKSAEIIKTTLKSVDV
ncbi:MAG: L-lactate dehydrogenase [Patescibacteria group bacterium]